MTRTRRLSLFAIVLAPAFWLGCNAILGNDEARFVPQEGGPGDESSTSDNVNPDGSQTDGSVEDADAEVTCDADLENDPLHCGRCTRDCLGGSCEAGTCGPVLIASDTQILKQLAVDGTHVYWSNQGTNPEIRRHVLLGSDGGAGELVHQVFSPIFLSGLAASAGRVYFATSQVLDAGVVSSCAVAGCAGGPAALQPVISPGRITIAGTTMFWSSDTNPGSITKCTLPACSDPVTIASGEPFPDVIAVSGTEAFWASTIKSYVHAAPVAGGGPTRSLVDDAGLTTGVAVNSARVYYVYPGKGIEVAPRAGGAPTLFSAAAPNAHDVAADEARVYFADFATTLFSCPAASCSSVTTVATVPASDTSGVILDDKSILWIAHSISGDQKIWRIAK